LALGQAMNTEVEKGLPKWDRAIGHQRSQGLEPRGLYAWTTGLAAACGAL
jgi:hypothetical protein